MSGDPDVNSPRTNGDPWIEEGGGEAEGVDREASGHSLPRYAEARNNTHLPDTGIFLDFIIGVPL